MLERRCEPEVMDKAEEAIDYDSMNHREVNTRFVRDLICFVASGDNGTRDGLHHKHIVDVGTGTALIPIELLSVVPEVASVLAVDLSMEMLKIAARRIRDGRLSDRILPVFSDAKRLAVQDQICDVVISNSIVHHIPEPHDVFREMRRVVRPGGILFVRDLMRPHSDAQVEHLVSVYAGNENAHQQQLFRQSLHAALTLNEVRALLEDCDLSPNFVSASSDRHWTITGRC